MVHSPLSRWYITCNGLKRARPAAGGEPPPDVRMAKLHTTTSNCVDIDDINLQIAGLLSDLAAVQTSPQKAWGYKQASSAIRELEEPVGALVEADGSLRKIFRVGPASSRVIQEVLEYGHSPLVEAAVDESGRRDEVEKRRSWRERFLSVATVRAVLADSSLQAVSKSDYRGDLQMHSTWSDGSQRLDQIVETGRSLGYTFAAVTDHSAGLPIARGVSRERFFDQWGEIDALNREAGGSFRLLKGVEANIGGDGSLDVSVEDRQGFDLVIAAPHSGLRSPELQTKRILTAIATERVHVLAHPRGRIYGSRPGVAADWNAVFDAAANAGVAIEVDGDPFRQDLDYGLVGQALQAGCLLALDSDAHATDQWHYRDIAIAHARLAGAPSDRIINTWPLDRLMAWATDRR
jgi:putative hydrolase